MNLSRNDYTPRMIDGQMAVWLQDCGWSTAKLGRDIVPGDVLRYNCGYTSTVVRIVKETAKTRTVEILSHYDNKLYMQSFRKDTYKPCRINTDR